MSNTELALEENVRGHRRSASHYGDWSNEDVLSWLKELNLDLYQEYKHSIKTSHIDGASFEKMTDAVFVKKAFQMTQTDASLLSTAVRNSMEAPLLGDRDEEKELQLTVADNKSPHHFDAHMEIEHSWTDTNSNSKSETVPLSHAAQIIAASRCKQLRCKTWTPSYTRPCVQCIYVVIAAICIPLGVMALLQSHSVTLQDFEPYDAHPSCSVEDGNYGRECTLNYTLDFDFEPPIYFHYKLSNFYQNHRSYVKSRSVKQLQGKDVLDVRHCDPWIVQRDQGTRLKMLPCGLIANSFFNDKFKVTYYPPDSDKRIAFCNDTAFCDRDENAAGWSKATWHASPNWENADIAWQSDVDGKFAPTAQRVGETTATNKLQTKQNVTLPSTDDEDLIVWMRTATVSSFYKLHRVINGQSLRKGGKLAVTIKNYFTVSSFSGSKAVAITTNSSLGGRNDVLPALLILVGAVSLLGAGLFQIAFPSTRSPSADLSCATNAM